MDESTLNGKTVGWVLDWFEKRVSVAGSDRRSKLAVNYFDAGLVDSLGVMDLILETEEAFGIKFNELDFQSRRFSTIGGFAEIVLERCS